jgi:thiamine biosynthesis protein ThiS
LIAQKKALSITLNGAKFEIPINTTVSDLLRILDADPALVAVEQNLLIVPKSEFASTKIAQDDRIEVVHFVGGG